MHELQSSDIFIFADNKPVKQYYSGQKDEKSEMREGIGCMIYNRNDYMQNYEGQFVSDNMHGYGEYQMQHPKYKYEGQFYVNKKEGYGRSSYSSGAYFEGLHRNDQRFGPGVYTDHAGYQDVGIWVDSRLVRLSRTIEPDDVMPRLAKRDEDKIRILRYRQIINLENNREVKNMPENLLHSLTHQRNYDKSVLNRAEELYNSLCRDDRSPSFNKPKYDAIFFGNDNSDHLTIDVLMTKEEMQQKIAGVEEIFEKTTNDILSTNHEEQWSIFKNSFITAKANYLPDEFFNEKNLRGSNETENSEEEFDDFGRKKIKDLQLTKKVIVTDLMAWNNSSLSIELLKHVFKHRKFEKNLSFDISKILAGRRGSFRQEGTHEKSVLQMFAACFNGFENKVLKLISNENLDVDVADSRGNTGLMLAAARDRIEVIETLLNLGANVDCINDECLTPLSLCALRLLELIHNVIDWSKAFLPKNITSESKIDHDTKESKNFELWHGRVSYESLVQQLPKQMDLKPLPVENGLQAETKDNFVAHDRRISKKLKAESRSLDDRTKGNMANRLKIQPQKYIFDLSPITGTPTPWKKSWNDKTKNKILEVKGKTKSDKIPSKSKDLLRDSKQFKEMNNAEISSKIEKINATISKLLQRGADPNFAKVPYPVLIMSIFTKTLSLVSELLDHGADPDTTLPKADHSLTPLLILAVLQPAHEHTLMAEALLKAKANPSLRADPEYRSDLLERLKQNRLPEFIDDTQGVTALHLLAIRLDIDSDVNEYLAQLIRTIYHCACIKKSDLYQGHSPLSLAILEGNLSTAKAFLKTSCVDVNEQLGADLGSAMLMLQSSMLQELLPPDILQEFLELLLEYGGCPLASAKVLGEEYNQIEYGRKELAKFSQPNLETTSEVKTIKNKIKSKGSKHLKSSDAKNFASSLAIVERIGKEKLITRIQENFVRQLLDSPIMRLSVERRLELLKETTFKNAQTWMTGEDVAIVMKNMNSPRTVVEELVKLFVTACVINNEKNLCDVNTLIQNQTNEIMDKVIPVEDQKRINTKSISVCGTNPNLDDNRFEVCFECLAVNRKALILCPKCKQVYFCSDECNVKSSAQKSNLHQCPVFYQVEWNRLEKLAATLSIDALSFLQGRLKDPKVYVDVENKIGQYQESKGKKISQSGAFVSTPKCEESYSKAFDGKPLTAGYENYYNEKSDNGHETKGKQQKTESDEQNKMEFKKQQKNSGGKKTDTGDMESSKKGTESFFENEVDSKSGNHNKKLREKKSDHFSENGIDASGKKGLRKTDEKINRLRSKGERKGDEGNSNFRSKKSDGERNTGGNKTVDNDIQSKKVKKNRNVTSFDEIDDETDQINKKVTRKGRKEDKFENNTGTIVIKSKRELDRNEELTGKKNDKKMNHMDIKDNIKKKHELAQRNDVKIARSEISEGLKNAEANMSSKRYKDNERYVDTKVPVKYLDWLSKVSRSAGKNLDIDLLLMPYVVFAQGDTYFRILAAGQYPDGSGNYSLI